MCIHILYLHACIMFTRALLAIARSLVLSLSLDTASTHMHACMQPTHAQDTHLEETIEEKSPTSVQKSAEFSQILHTPHMLTREPAGHASRHRYCAHKSTKKPYIRAKLPCISGQSPIFPYTHAPHLEE